MPIERPISFAPANFVYRKDVMHYRVRGLLDAFAAALLLVAASPVLLITSVAIVIEDGAPVLFSQYRVGQYETRFRIWKLRTMRREECHDGISPTTLNDRRVTRVGRILRKLSIDELPQLVNVVLGEMALVGPRPEMPFVVARYEGWQHLRHLVRPGITGLWQVELRKTVPMHTPQATALDIEYIRSASLQTDGHLLARTVVAIIHPKGAF